MKGAPPNREIALYGFLEDGKTFLTKSGDCGIVLECEGVDPECLGQAAVDRVADRLEAAFQIFDERTLFQELYFRHEHPPLDPALQGHPVLDRAARSRAEHLRRVGLFEERLFYVLLYLDPRAERNIWQALRNRQIGSYLRRRRFQELIEAEVRETRERLQQKASEFALQLRDVLPLRVLGFREAFPVLWGLVNFERAEPPAFERTEQLDERLADSFIAGGDDYSHLTVGDQHTIVLGLKALPAGTRPLLLRELQSIRESFTSPPRGSVRLLAATSRIFNGKRSITGAAGGEACRVPKIIARILRGCWMGRSYRRWTISMASSAGSPRMNTPGFIRSPPSSTTRIRRGRATPRRSCGACSPGVERR